MGRHRGGKLWGGPLVRGQKRDIKTFPSKADVTENEKYVKKLRFLTVLVVWCFADLMFGCFCCFWCFGGPVFWWFGVLLCR